MGKPNHGWRLYGPDLNIFSNMTLRGRACIASGRSGGDIDNQSAVACHMNLFFGII